jgi:flavin-dependent dehydrogenase
MASQALSSACDVIVIGGGLAGKAASLHLARAGLSVTCIEPADAARQAFGESLDWSAPDLLKALGLPMERLVSERMATWKRHVTLQFRDGCSERYIPSAWLARTPFRVELRTLHVDRMRLDEELLSLATAQGVTVVPDKVVGVEREGNKILSVKTVGGSIFVSSTTTLSGTPLIQQRKSRRSEQDMRCGNSGCESRLLHTSPILHITGRSVDLLKRRPNFH